MNSPLYQLESEYRFMRDKQEQIRQQLDAVNQEEDRLLYEMRKKNFNAIQQHLESYRKEFSIKILNDPDIARDSLQKAADFYSQETNKMRSDLSRGGRQYEMTHQQQEKIKELESKIANLQHKISSY